MVLATYNSVLIIDSCDNAEMITANVPIINEPTGLETNVFRQPGSADKSSVNISWSPPNPLGKFIFLLNPTAISYASEIVLVLY